MHKTKKVNKKRKLIKRLVVLLLVVLVACGGSLYYRQTLQPAGSGKKEVLFQIKSGDSYDTVLSNLEEKDLIKSKTTAKIYARLSGHNTYYAGYYRLNNGMSTSEILDYIADIDNANKEQISITVTEGEWAKDVAKSIAKKYPKYSEDEIIEKWNDSDYIKQLAEDYEFLDADELNSADVKIKLEGYLYPQTYLCDPDATIDDITRSMLDQFDTIYQKYKSKIKKSGYSTQEIVTLASIVQFESGKKSDMKKIAGVFYNRLKKDMKLESSVTVCYALYDDFVSPSACEVNTDVDSPYNTYQNEGLPVGPIDNPGEDAINAVLNPEESDYLYFLADVNGDGTVYYFKTYEEHKAKMEELNLNIE